jgi:hypothetical protein
MNLLSEYRQITRDIVATTKRLSAEPSIKRQADDYLANIAKVKSVDDFMSNDKVYRFAVTAFGLKDMIYAKAFIRKALTDGIDNPNSFTTRLADSRFREFVETFNFARYGSTATSFDRTQQGTVDRFLRASLEERAGTQDERLRMALYFKRKAPGVASTYSILADKALYAVVRTAVGIPAAASVADIDKQADLITKKVNIADFSDPAKLEKFLTKYLARAETENSGQFTTAISPAISLLQGSAVDNQTLISIQNLRKYNS